MTRSRVRTCHCIRNRRAGREPCRAAAEARSEQRRGRDSQNGGGAADAARKQQRLGAVGAVARDERLRSGRERLGKVREEPKALQADLMRRGGDGALNDSAHLVIGMPRESSCMDSTSRLPCPLHRTQAELRHERTGEAGRRTQQRATAAADPCRERMGRRSALAKSHSP